ncbi:hypothetical protein BBJ28_00002241 [Nothophytophthora sp. Chile5]|nr:hypothetical protein BBJ28_00002241 [Nothophytophthora sp. Chile5]
MEPATAQEEEEAAHTEPHAPAAAASIEQAYRSRYNETIAPPGGPLSRASKRAELIEVAEVELKDGMEELEAAVHAYNVDFQQRIDAVKQRGREFETKLGSEYESMADSIQQLETSFSKQFQTAFLALEQQTLLHECDAGFHTFAYTTVPAIMETLQGSITRKMEKNYETFDIENAKIQKREKKTLHALESTERKTDASFRTETARRVIKFQERDEEFHHVMRVDNRGSERQQAAQVEGLVVLHAQLQAERSVRETEDLEILDKLTSSLARLQASILENLGEDTTAA